MGIAYIRMVGHHDSDDRERAKLASSLTEDLRRLDEVLSIGPDATGPTPPGAKGSIVEWANLAVEFSGALPLLVDMISRWAGRHNHASVRVSIDGDEIELNAPRASEREALVNSWLARHGGTTPEA